MFKWTNTCILLLLLVTACKPAETPTGSPVHSSPEATSTPLVIQTAPRLLLGDGGLLSEKPCAAPCFLGIIIGETPQAEVTSLLKEQGILECIQDSEKALLCNESILISFNPSTMIVDGIGFRPDNSVLVQDILEKYGKPDSIHVIPSGTPEAPATTMLLFFDSIKMRIHLPEIQEVDYAVSDQSKIDWVTYFDDASYSDFKGNMFSQPWEGYGNYHPGSNP